MDKVYRAGANVLVALQSATPRRLAQHWETPAAPLHATPDPAVAAVVVPRNWRAVVKRAIRLPVKIVYRTVKPFLMPLSFRVRRYLYFDVQSDLMRYHHAEQQAIERVLADLLRETQASREQLRHELLGGHQQALNAQRKQFEERIGEMEAASPQRLVHLFEGMIDAQRDAFQKQGQQFEERISQMEAASPQRLVHLFERMITKQQEAFVEQGKQFEHRISQAEAAGPERMVYLFDGMIKAQNESFAAHGRQFEQRIGEMEAASPQRLVHLFEGMMTGQRDALLEQRRQLDEQIAAVAQQQLALGQQTAALAQQQSAMVHPMERIDTNSYATARRVVIPADRNRLLIKTEAGYVVCPSDDLAVVALLVESGDLEPGTRKLIGKLLTPGDVYVDVGANLGLHTVAAGRAMQHRGKIIAFEPFPNTRALLHETLHINGMLSISTIHQAAVSDRAGRHLFYLGNTCGHHSLFALSGTEASEAPPIEVDTVRLDDVLADLETLTLLKIDAEGAELAVVRGAAATLAAHANVGLIVEFGVSHLVRNGYSTAAWLAEFTALGFDYQAIDPNTGALQRWSQAQLEAVDSINLLFARPASPLWHRAVA